MIVFPMCGLSSRFKNKGYQTPKFMLPLGDNSNLFKEVLLGFKKYFELDTFLFIINEDEEVFEFVNYHCVSLKISKFQIIQLSSQTKGQAETVYLGINKLKNIYNQDGLFIFNIDTIRINFTKPSNEFLENTYGYLEVFEGEGNQWSFVEPLQKDVVLKTTEKIKVSDLCSNGLYYFKNINTFCKYFKLYNYKEFSNEPYIAPLFNLLIEDNKIVKFIKIKSSLMKFAGTPEEYEQIRLEY